MIRHTACVLAAALLSACATTSAPEIAPALPEMNVSLQTAVAAQSRAEANRVRDVYRHPAETLNFFGVKPEMAVMEIWPGAGYYTEILAPYLRDKGRYVAAAFVVDTPEAPKYFQRIRGQYQEKLAANPALYDKVEVVSIGKPDRFQPVAVGSMDAVLTFRNVHNWMKDGNEKEMFAAFFAALKPGGILGVVEHRAAPGTDIETMKTSGYVTEALVIEMAKSVGFKLDAQSEVNANPRDTKDHPKGVWTLPPSLALKEVDREKYVAMGESDRMTLRFVKPQ